MACLRPKNQIPISAVYWLHEYHENRDMIRVYTDGSCHPASGTGGWAAVILIEKKRIYLTGRSPATTHQRMELTSAIKALRHLQKLHMTGEEIILVYTDSQYLAGFTRRKTKLLSADLMTKKKQPIRNE